jgi:hypothetical protein
VCVFLAITRSIAVRARLIMMMIIMQMPPIPPLYFASVRVSAVTPSPPPMRVREVVEGEKACCGNGLGFRV